MAEFLLVMIFALDPDPGCKKCGSPSGSERLVSTTFSYYFFIFKPFQIGYRRYVSIRAKDRAIKYPNSYRIVPNRRMSTSPEGKWCSCPGKMCRGRTAQSGTLSGTAPRCCSLSPPGTSGSLCSLHVDFFISYLKQSMHLCRYYIGTGSVHVRE